MGAWTRIGAKSTIYSCERSMRSVVVWNQDHVLNTSLGNCLTIKMRVSCELLYMLTICTQLREMNLKKIIVATKSGALDAAGS
jgi:hypothetical protein